MRSLYSEVRYNEGSLYRELIVPTFQRVRRDEKQLSFFFSSTRAHLSRH